MRAERVRDRCELRTFVRNAQQATGQGHPMAIEAYDWTDDLSGRSVLESPFTFISPNDPKLAWAPLLIRPVGLVFSRCGHASGSDRISGRAAVRRGSGNDHGDGHPRASKPRVSLPVQLFQIGQTVHRQLLGIALTGGGEAFNISGNSLP